MIVKARPSGHTPFHVHNKKKYYPGQSYQVEDELGETLIRRNIADDITPAKRGPGRPRKTEPLIQDPDAEIKVWRGPPMQRRGRR